jgi:hypothetical protein
MNPTPISPYLGGLDSPATRRAIHRAALDVDFAAAERQAHVDVLSEAFAKAVKAGDARAYAFFSPTRWPDKKSRSLTRAPTVGELVMQSLDERDFWGRAAQVLIDCANADPSGKAAALLAEAGAQWADQEATGA